MPPVFLQHCVVLVKSEMTYMIQSVHVFIVKYQIQFVTINKTCFNIKQIQVGVTIDCDARTAL